MKNPLLVILTHPSFNIVYALFAVVEVILGFKLNIPIMLVRYFTRSRVLHVG